MLVCKAELPGDIGYVLCAVFFRNIAHGVLCVEGLGHVEAVEPHLAGIDFLVPESTLGRARLLFQLLVQAVHGAAVFRFAGDVVEREQGVSGADVVKGIIALFVFPAYCSCGVDDGVIPGVDVADGGLIAFHDGGIEESLEFQAGSVVPLQIALLAVDVGGFGVSGHFGTDHI